MKQDRSQTRKQRSGIVHTEEIKELFNRFLEREEPLFERDIGGFRYWHYIRFHVFTDVLINRGWIQYTDVRKHTPLYRIVSLAGSLLLNSLRYSIRRDTLKSKLLFLQTSKAMVHRGRMINPNTDILRESLSFPTTVWEEPMRWFHAPLSNRNGLFFLDSLHLTAFFRSLFPTAPTVQVNDEIAFLNHHLRELGIRLPENRMRFLMHRAVRLRRYFAGPVRRALARKSVKVIILVNYYDPVKMAITEAARDLGIYVVELQHGSMGRYNIGYNFGRVGPLPALPDEIWTYGPFWNRSVRIEHTGVRLEAVGSPYVEERVKDTTPPAPSTRVKILIISQWTLTSELEETALTLVRGLDRERYEIVYKLHPGETQVWRTAYSGDFLTADITVVEQGDLYELFNEADLIVGVYSTALIESLHFGKQLILLDRYGIHFFEDLVSSGRAVLAKDSGDILAFIQKTDVTKRRSYDTGTFWTSGSLDHMKKRLDVLLETGQEYRV